MNIQISAEGNVFCWNKLTKWVVSLIYYHDLYLPLMWVTVTVCSYKDASLLHCCLPVSSIDYLSDGGVPSLWNDGSLALPPPNVDNNYANICKEECWVLAIITLWNVPQVIAMNMQIQLKCKCKLSYLQYLYFYIFSFDLNELLMMQFCCYGSWDAPHRSASSLELSLVSAG